MATSYKSGSVVCHQYERMNGKFLKNFLKPNFQKTLVNAGGYPSQNCKTASKVMELYGVKQVSIPARSPDINSIESFF